MSMYFDSYKRGHLYSARVPKKKNPLATSAIFDLPLLVREGQCMARKALLFLLFSVVCAFPGQAHAVLMSSTPLAKQVVAGPEVAVELRFNSRIDARRSRLVLVAPDGSEMRLAIAGQPSPERLKTRTKAFQSGGYILRWQVLASDGHITRGEIPFTVQ